MAAAFFFCRATRLHAKTHVRSLLHITNRRAAPIPIFVAHGERILFYIRTYTAYVRV